MVQCKCNLLLLEPYFLLLYPRWTIQQLWERKKRQVSVFLSMRWGDSLAGPKNNVGSAGGDSWEMLRSPSATSHEWQLSFLSTVTKGIVHYPPATAPRIEKGMGAIEHTKQLLFLVMLRAAQEEEKFDTSPMSSSPACILQPAQRWAVGSALTEQSIQGGCLYKHPLLLSQWKK